MSNACRYERWAIALLIAMARLATYTHAADDEHEAEAIIHIATEPESVDLLADLVQFFMLSETGHVDAGGHRAEYSVELQPTSAAARDRCYAGHASLCTTISLPLASEQTTYPNMTWLPLWATALVPIMHLHVGQGAARSPGEVPTAELVLNMTQSIVAKILMGYIHRWNDSEIAAAQTPEVRGLLPSEIITIVLNPDSRRDRIIMDMMQFAEPALFNQTFGTYASIPLAWPYWRYASHINTTDATAVVASTLSTFSLVPMNEAILSTVSRAPMINAGGHLVESTAYSVAFALAEATSTGTIHEGVLTRAQAVGAWPITYVIYLGFHNRHSLMPSTYADCATVQVSIIEMVRFVLRGAELRKFATTHGYFNIPELVREALGTDGVVDRELQCDGESIVVFQGGRIVVVGSSVFGIPVNHWAGAYLQYNELVLDIAIESSDDALDTVYDVYNPVARHSLEGDEESGTGEAAIVGLTSPTLINVNMTARRVLDTRLAAATTPNALAVTPFLMYSVVPIFHFSADIDALLTTGANPPGLVMTMDVLNAIFNASISQWTDPLLVALNPALTTMFAGKLSTINVVVCCDAGAAGVRTTATGDLFTRVLSNGATGPGYMWTAALEKAPERFVVSSDQARNEALVLTTDNAIGYTLKQTDHYDIGFEVAIAFDDPSTGARVVHKPALEGLALCANERGFADIQSGAHPYMLQAEPSREAAAQATAAGLNPTAIIARQQAVCWPFHDAMAFISLTRFTSAVSPVSPFDERYVNNECSAGRRALQLAEWILTSSDTLDWNAFADLSGFLMFRSTTLHGTATPILHKAALDTIYGITCDGATLVRTFPQRWVMSSGLTTASRALAIFGYTLCLFTLIGLVYFRHSQTFVASSVPFMAVTTVGLALIFGAIPTLFDPNQTVSSCNIFMFLANFGFTLIFTPFFIKQWRVYRIFDNRKLSVVKLTNALLLTVTGALLAYDAVVLGLWVVMAPLQPTDFVDVESGRTLVYRMCSIQTTSSWMWTFPALLIGEKGTLMLFGTYVGVSSRRVAQRYSESSAIAYVVYSITFMAALLVLVWLAVEPQGDALMSLILIVMAWPTLLTWALLYAPRFVEVFGLLRGDSDVALTDVQHWFSMFSYDLMPYGMLARYVHALQTELTAAQRRLITMPKPKTIHPHTSPSPDAIPLTVPGHGTGGGTGGGDGVGSLSGNSGNGTPVGVVRAVSSWAGAATGPAGSSAVAADGPASSTPELRARALRPNEGSPGLANRGLSASPIPPVASPFPRALTIHRPSGSPGGPHVLGAALRRPSLRRADSKNGTTGQGQGSDQRGGRDSPMIRPVLPQPAGGSASGTSPVAGAVPATVVVGAPVSPIVSLAVTLAGPSAASVQAPQASLPGAVVVAETRTSPAAPSG